MALAKSVTREMIINGAFNLLKREGAEGINARSIAKEINCSTQPLYSEFKNMDELKKALLAMAMEYYKEYSKSFVDGSYLSYGMVFLRFSIEEKYLFRYLYLRKRDNPVDVVDDANINDIIASMTNSYDLSKEKAILLHKNMGIYALGLAVMLNYSYSVCTAEELKNRLELEFKALYPLYKN